MTLVLVDVADRVATLTLNNPEERNTLTRPLVEEIIAFLSPSHGVERLRVTDEDEYFPPPRNIRELQAAIGTAAAAMVGGPTEASATLDDRSLAASDVLAALHREGEVLVEVHDAEAVRVRARIPDATAGRFAEFVVA